jgi:oligopeptide transport system permease protein
MTDLSAATTADIATKGRSLWDDARRRLFKNPAAVVSMGVLIVLTVLALIGMALSVMTVPGQTQTYVEMIYRDSVGVAPNPAQGFWLGTDSEGRDVMARLLFGLSVSLAVGIVATLVSLVIGVLWGAIAGYVGGGVDNVMMRAVDVLYSVPFIFFVILLMVTVGEQLNDPIQKLLLIFVAIGAVEWLTTARIVRGQTIALKNKEFIEAARAGGVAPFTIILRHIVPNLLGPVVVFATINVARVILLEAFLSFLGLGVQEPLTSLGALIAQGAAQMEIAPWLIIFPAAMMFITLLSLNFLGDGLRDALDPKER